MLLAAAVLGEDDIGDLEILAVRLAGVVGDGVDLDGLAIGVALARLSEGGLASAKFLDDLLRGDAGGLCGVERAEAGNTLRLRRTGRIRDSCEGTYWLRR